MTDPTPEQVIREALENPSCVEQVSDNGSTWRLHEAFEALAALDTLIAERDQFKSVALARESLPALLWEVDYERGQFATRVRELEAERDRLKAALRKRGVSDSSIDRLAQREQDRTELTHRHDPVRDVTIYEWKTPRTEGAERGSNR